MVAVHTAGGRLRTRLQGGLLRAQRLHGPPDRCRIGLLASTALLLGGDHLELDVEVGPGATLELVDVAGTVAYDGRGAPARWDVSVRVAAGGRLSWAGEPFVVADGADVERRLELDVADGGQVLLRETVVLGRAGQLGGRLRNRTRVRRAGGEVLVEDLRLTPDGLRPLPGMLGDLRVLDSLLAVGWPLTPPQDAPAGDGATVFRLADPHSFLVRHLGPGLAASPLPAWWAAAGPRRGGSD